MGLSLKLLGEFEVRDGSGQPLALPTRKTRALLAYLAVNADKPQQRDRLMALLWSDRGEQQARHSLNQALMSIRRLGNAAGIALLDGDGERVTLLGAAIAIDIADFRNRLAGDPTGAVALYEGPFLDGLTIPDPAFEEWQTATRSELHDSVCDALSRASDQATKDGDTAAGIDTLRRLVALDPMHEIAHRRLMKLLHDNGDRAGALRQYQSCAEILKKELQVEPDAATKALFEAIRTDSSPPVEATAPSSASKASQPSLPDRPSIAVLSFTNLSGDPEQDFFGDGLAEDIITELSRFRSLFVIARNSSFTYKGRIVDVKTVAHDLGVRYVLEGSVRKAGRRIRVASQLIDAETGDHLWADRYDRDLTDIFAVQDEITRSIVTAIAPGMLVAEIAGAQRKAPESLSAWQCVIRGNAHFWRGTREDFAAAAALYEQAIALDPNYAAAHSAKATVKVCNAFLGWGGRISEELADALASAQRALVLDDGDAMAHFAAGFVYSMMRRSERAIEEQRIAIDLNPNAAEGHFGLCLALTHAGEVEAALEAIAAARQVSPRGPAAPMLTVLEAITHFHAGKYEEAVRLATRAIEERADDTWPYLICIAALGQLGWTAEARNAASKVLQFYPSFSLARHERTVPIAGGKQRAHYIEGLRKAGLPE